MARFAIECPKCGSINTAQTGLFAKKTIKCATCNEEIDIKTSRMTSKICPHCGKTFVYDQASGKDKKCPSCGKKLNAVQAATGKYKYEKVNCPQCACSIEVDATCEIYDCPVCNCKINVKKELEKAKLVNNSTVSVIQYEGNNSTFVWKHPIEDFNSGSILNVHESQEAIFFLNGRMLDTFEKGQHILESENLPILRSVHPIPTGGPTPFHAEVYFVNKTVHMGLKWGTDSRVHFIDPVAQVQLDIGACGELNLYVTDARKLLTKLVGTASSLVDRQVLCVEDKSSKSLQGFFRAPMMTVIKSFLASEIVNQQINILAIDQKLGELSNALLKHISPVYEEFGLAVSHFYISNISLPEDNKDFQEMKALMSARYREIEKRRLEATIAAEQRAVELEAKKTELETSRVDAEIREIKAQAEAKEKWMLGKTEAEIMAAKGYTGKDELELERQKAWAEGFGKSGSSGGAGGGSNVGNDMIGMMMSMKMAGMAMDQFDAAMGTNTPSKDATNSTQTTPAEDPIEVLSKLKKMLDAGLIEQAEYDAKKQEILKRM